MELNIGNIAITLHPQTYNESSTATDVVKLNTDKDFISLRINEGETGSTLTAFLNMAQARNLALQLTGVLFEREDNDDE